jgi:flagellar hook-associated protein 2
MATISSLGVGSGLAAEDIVTKLVALEKQPLRTLELKATQVKAQVSAFGQIQSQFSALSDVATRISSSASWSSRTASSSNTAAASITALATTAATSFTLDVDALAQSQSVSTSQIASGGFVGAGTLTFQLGTWTGSGASFAAGTSSAVEVVATATDTVTTLAAKINAANAGVVATPFSDGSQERLLLRSKDTGEAAGFRVLAVETVSDGNVATGLSRFNFDPTMLDGGLPYGMASATNTVQYGGDAKARINGLAVTSKTNTLTNNIPGVTINLTATTTTFYNNVGGTEVKSPVTMAIREDVTPAVKNVQDFITAYNALSSSLAELTKYDAATKTASLFQGDAAVLGLQSVLRNMVGSVTSGSAYQRLSDVGLERQLNGSLTLNTAKLSTAANNGTELQKLFTGNNNNALTNGFALKFSALAKGVLASGGSVANKAEALDKSLVRNTQDQTRVNDRAASFEARIRKQYSALDAKMAGLTALNAYVAQQVTTWNKST